MGTTTEKLQYTLDSVNDIQAALIEKGVEVADTDALGTYGDKVRSLTTGMNLYSVSTDISAGTWTGATLKDSSWVDLCSKSTDSSWTYYFDREIDITKIQFIAASFYASSYIRLPRGIDGSTPTYQYFPAYYIYGNKGGNTGSSMNTYSTYCQVTLSIDNYPGYSTDSAKAYLYVYVYKDRIMFSFTYSSRGLGAIRITNPIFNFNIGYL